MNQKGWDPIQVQQMAHITKTGPGSEKVETCQSRNIPGPHTLCQCFFILCNFLVLSLDAKDVIFHVKIREIRKRWI